jgi:hypothetical protein
LKVVLLKNGIGTLLYSFIVEVLVESESVRGRMIRGNKKARKRVNVRKICFLDIKHT